MVWRNTVCSFPAELVVAPAQLRLFRSPERASRATSTRRGALLPLPAYSWSGTRFFDPSRRDVELGLSGLLERIGRGPFLQSILLEWDWGEKRAGRRHVAFAYIGDVGDRLPLRRS